MNILILLLVMATTFTLSYALTYWLLHRERARMSADWEDIAHEHETYGERLTNDDTRLGINTGIEYATSKMKNTLAEIETHVEQRQ